MIEDDFYATLKLKTGEEIFAKVAPSEESDRTILLLSHPITISESNDVEIIMVYQSFVRDSAADKSNQAAMSRKMGYLGKVDDTKEILEKIFKNSNRIMNN